ncbi:hypothetical protein [Acrocarpospora phusangensis]|nr:hypothetical protein [Acrocarpospora phusangensis]
MGFVRANELTIDFDEDHELHGLEVKIRRLSVEEFVEVEKVLDGPGLLPKIDVFAQLLISWNNERPDGSAIPANAEGLRSMDLQFATMLMNGFTRVVTGAPRPLAASSRPGGPDPEVEASIPME